MTLRQQEWFLKTCSKCNVEKPFVLFTKSKRCSLGVSGWCKSCHNEYNRDWGLRTGKKQKDKARYARNRQDGKYNRYRLRQYDLTPEQFDDMFERQGKACAICRSTVTAKGKLWAVDHDHTTGKVRAILCSNCNSGLGLFKDSTERLRAATSYLESFEEVTYEEPPPGAAFFGGNDDRKSVLREAS